MKMSTFCTRLVLFLVYFSETVRGSTVSFDASPKELKANLSTAASMRCAVHNGYNASFPSYASTANDIRHITSIFVTKNGNDDVASVTSYDAPAALTDPGNLQVKGSLSATSGEGYIELTWADAAAVELGEYQCTVGAVDSKGHIVQLTAALEMTAVQPGIADVMSAFKDLNSKLDNQQQTITQQQQTINQLTQDCTSQKNTISRLLANNNGATRPVCTCPTLPSAPAQQPQQHIPTSLTSSQLASINKMAACSAARVAFTARLSTGKHSIQEDDHVTYSDMLENEPGDYNANTGVFTCREAGVYLFNLHAMGDEGEEAALELNLNGNRMTGLGVEDADKDKNSASTSAVVRLKAGDQVKVIATDDSLLDQDHHTHGNSFSGVLIHSDACLS